MLQFHCVPPLAVAAEQHNRPDLSIITRGFPFKIANCFPAIIATRKRFSYTNQIYHRLPVPAWTTINVWACLAFPQILKQFSERSDVSPKLRDTLLLVKARAVENWQTALYFRIKTIKKRN
ncbi:hypothetical protein PoB_002561700 [Plakobranchus ocellatus]|uniref:Uncharacterized protein n=1 Tax=Plakobranchus ocellatus TaxID=259542 RepID=A0AAV3ZX30_9GAST|nr:hypothetical protein PoB_002561700 [Plakobranchus ocellatus]